jgi:hypothetical protein
MGCPTPPGPRPAFIEVPLTARAVLAYTIFNQTVQNVFHFSKLTEYDDTDVATLANEIVTSWDTNLKPTLSADVVLVSVTVTALYKVDGPQFVASANITGTNGGAGFESIGNTIAIKFGSGQAGRSFRGRTYWPQVLAAAVTNNELALATAGVYIAALTDFFDDVNVAIGDKHVIVSYQNNCTWRTEGVATPVNSYSIVDLHLDSQRRRLSGRGI